MPSVNFFREDVAIKLPAKAKVTLWLMEGVLRQGYSIGSINYIFCSDSYLKALNIQYLDHHTFTDVITFDNSEDIGLIEGDIFISVDTVHVNAHRFSCSFERELLRVMAHGVLHLLGYNDKTRAEQAIIRKEEEEWLKSWDELFHVKR